MKMLNKKIILGQSIVKDCPKIIYIIRRNKIWEEKQ